MQPGIGDYAVIGDCRSAALVSSGGSIDWLCLPRFDSPAIFAAILDPLRGGSFGIRPTERATTTRQYLGLSNVLETTFTTSSGVLRVTDLMPVDSETGKSQQLWPDHEILRKVECLDGRVPIEVLFDPRFEYGLVTPPIRCRRPGLFYAEHGTTFLAVNTDLRLQSAEGRPGLAGTEVLEAGSRRYLSMSFAHAMPGVLVPLGRYADARIDRSIRWWEAWAGGCTYDGPYRDAVVRSALALKLLSYAPSGAIVAAPTTSLPEDVGGIRNWDYRYCWLRDASLILRALLDVGFEVEAEAFLSWLLHATHLTWPHPRVAYDVYGESDLHERELSELAGYAGSRPVRVGNLAAHQFQLDVYGEVAESAFLWVTHGGSLDRASKKNLVELGHAVSRRWREPDDGIWERRAARRHHTHSKAMCWIVLDRLLKLHEAGHLRVPAGRYSEDRDAIRREIEERGYNHAVGSYVSVLDGDDVDASLLVLALHGYADAAGPRMQSTRRRIRERLGAGNLLYRYREEDGLSGGEGAFGICGFWEVECLALGGDHTGAVRQFESLAGFANDVGLLAEEVDPATGALLGNFPQGLTHVGLINAALSLQENRP
jgi:GH15 family glucan-1,4-alpha-glucosidase